MTHPYKSLKSNAFWKSGVLQSDPEAPFDIFQSKWDIAPEDKIATAGSCFAQHIARNLRKRGFKVLDVEPAPEGMTQQEASDNGYGIYSARYGNLYTATQCLQLLQEALGEHEPSERVWEKDGRYFDPLRPSVPVNGYDSPQDVLDERSRHLAAVKRMFEELDIFIFTMGLTEAWRIKQCGTILPIAPEIIAGQFDEEKYEFVNFRFNEIKDAFEEFLRLLARLRGDRGLPRILLTVSPVPLTATASGQHVLVATTYSKSTLRTVAHELVEDHPEIDYFPSYEIITNIASESKFYADNLRSIADRGVQTVMRTFFDESPPTPNDVKSEGRQHASIDEDDDLNCEEVLLEAFAPDSEQSSRQAGYIAPPQSVNTLIVGDSHLASFQRSLKSSDLSKFLERPLYAPVNFLASRWNDFDANHHLTRLKFNSDKSDKFPDIDVSAADSSSTLILVGIHLLGDGIVRAHGPLRAGSPDMENGLSISPVMPIIENSTPELVETYKRHFEPLRSSAEILANKSRFRKIIWIASPDMTERTAEFRFGKDYVQSGSHVAHRQAAREAMDLLFQDLDNIELFFHLDEFLNPKTGFTRDEFALNEIPYDIHVSEDFFNPVLEKAISSIQLD